jgi:hypothetical protein
MNILGQPFAPWVTKQINVRQQSLGNSTNLTNNNLLYQNAKSPWLRLASSVNIEQEGEFPDSLAFTKIIKSTSLPPEAIGGDTPARNFILQGGSSRIITSELNDAFNSARGNVQGQEAIAASAGTTRDHLSEQHGSGVLNSGLFSQNESSNKIFPVYGSAYGWGGLEDRGYAPMPGLTGATVQYYNNGALAKATIKMKCFTRNQMALMDALYMRVGFNLLLEFGWSQYLDNDGLLQTFDNFLSPALSYLFEPYAVGGKTPTHFDILDLIQDERIARDGNYEGVFGKITNFNWSFNSDGSYDCSVNLTGMGDMMESLKVNIKLPSKSDSISPLFSSPFADPDTADGDTTIPPLIANKNKTTLNKLLFEIYQSIKPQAEGGDVYQDFTLPSFPVVKSTVDGNGKTTTEFSKTFDLDIEKGLLALQGTTTDDKENSSPQVYLTFGSLLALVQKYLLMYNPDTGCPLFAFDVNFENIGEDENYIVNIPGRFSSNPLICLVPYTGINQGMADEISNGSGLISQSSINETLKQSSNRYFVAESSYLTRLCNIYLNINMVAGILDTSKRSEDGSLSLLSFLNNIISSFTLALGGINMISIKVDEVTQQIKFIENAPQRFDIPRNQTQEYARINTFGVKPDTQGSFVKNIVMQGSISPEYSSMISIGAQISGNTLSANATGFSAYNYGLVDRVIPKKQNADYDAGASGSADPVELGIIDVWNKQINYSDGESNSLFWSIYDQRLFTMEDCTALTELNYNFISLMSGWLVDNNQLQSPSFLPFNLSFDIDGLSGIRLFEKFLIDDYVLPPGYGEGNVDLLVKSLNHEINTSDWTTQIDTQAAPSKKLDPVKKPATLTSSTTTQTYNPGVGEQPKDMLPLEDELLRIRLTRIMDDSTQTLGIMEVLDVDEQTVLFTLATSELPWKGNQNSISCIPTGKYRVKSHVSPKHGRCFWLVGNEAGDYKFNQIVGNGYTRTAVLIHMFPKAPGWALGCIGPGLRFNDQSSQTGRQQGTGQLYLNPSKSQSFKALDKLLDVLYSQGSFKMTISNQGGVGSTFLPSSLTTEVRNLAVSKNLLPNPA